MSRHNKISKKVLILVFIASCVSIKTLENKLENYTVIEGKLGSYRVDKKNKMFISLETEQGNILGVLRNNKDSLIDNIVLNLSNVDLEKSVFLYGKTLDRPIDEYLRGVDYNISIIAYYDSGYKKYIFIQVDYSNRFTKEYFKNGLNILINFVFNQAKKTL